MLNPPSSPYGAGSHRPQGTRHYQPPREHREPPPEHREPPAGVRRGVLLLRVSAGLQAAALVPLVVTGGLTAATVIGTIVAVLVYLWLSEQIRAGRNWARITGLVLFILTSIVLALLIVGVLASVQALGQLVLLQTGISVIQWMVNLQALRRLWDYDSKPYFC